MSPGRIAFLPLWIAFAALFAIAPAHAQIPCTPALQNTVACFSPATNLQLTDLLTGMQAVGPQRSPQSVKITPQQLFTLFGSPGALTLTDGTHTVTPTGQITVTGATVGGTSPNATLTITGGGGGSTLTFGTHLTGGSYNGGSPITLGTDATNANTASTIVARDPSGNFTAGTITSALTGHASLDLLLSGGTLTGELISKASATGGAGLNLPPGAAPTSPANGDLWATSAGVFAQVAGSTVGPFGTGGGGGGNVSNSGTPAANQLAQWVSSTAIQGINLNAGVGTALGNALNGSGGLIGFSLIGTSGATIPLLNGANTWSGGNTFSGTLTGTLTGGASLDLPLAGGTLTGKAITAASTTSNAGLNLPQGSAPTSPVNGDLWTTSSGVFARIAGSTVGPLGSGSGSVSITVDPTTPNLAVSPSPITGTGVMKTVIPLIVSSASTYTYNGTGTSGTGAQIDNTYVIQLTAASPTFVLPQAGTTGFAASVGSTILFTGTGTLAITTTTSTICGQASISLQPQQALNIASDGTNWQCAISFPPVVPAGTIASGKNLGLDSSNRLVTATVSGGSSAFSALTSATNTTAAMVVGTGASLAVSGSGTIGATAAPVSGLTGAGTGVVPALQVNTGSAGAFTLNNAVNTFTASQRVAYQTPTISTATFTPAVASGNNISIGLTSACPCTLANFSGTLIAGQQGVIEITQDGTGSRTIGTWGSEYTATGGTASITLSTAAGVTDTIPYEVNKAATSIVLGAPILNPVH